MRVHHKENKLTHQPTGFAPWNTHRGNHQNQKGNQWGNWFLATEGDQQNAKSSDYTATLSCPTDTVDMLKPRVATCVRWLGGAAGAGAGGRVGLGPGTCQRWQVAVAADAAAVAAPATAHADGAGGNQRAFLHWSHGR